MNKLREKFKMYIDLYKEEYLAEQLEQITDDFSVKLLIWTANSEPIKSIDYTKSDVDVATELQQYFKDNIYGKE